MNVGLWLGCLLVVAIATAGSISSVHPPAVPPASATGVAPVEFEGGRVAQSPAVDNFTASVNRLVELLGLAGSGLLSLVWARVALSWFSNDITKKVQAKDRARDALIGTLLFVAAITGLFWGLAHWVLTGT